MFTQPGMPLPFPPGDQFIAETSEGPYLRKMTADFTNGIIYYYFAMTLVETSGEVLQLFRGSKRHVKEWIIFGAVMNINDFGPCAYRLIHFLSIYPA